MNIRRVQAFTLAYPEPHYKGVERYITLARVEADNGLVGWGECISQFREATLATKIIIEQGFAPLITGENVGQVASQTISNIRATSESVNIPILRPLSGMNKEEIINIAIDIGTYDISIQPYEDCCSFFVPLHPSTSANLERVKTIENNLKLDDLYNQLIIDAVEEKISFYE